MASATDSSGVQIPRFMPRPWVVWPLMAVVATAAAGMLYLFDPRVQGNYPPCPFLFFTGCYCPGCGTLRALHGLLHGNVLGALGYNPLTVLSIPFLAVAGIVAAAKSFGWQSFLGITISHRVAFGVAATVLVFWILRNVPVYPFTVLAP